MHVFVIEIASRVISSKVFELLCLGSCTYLDSKSPCSLKVH